MSTSLSGVISPLAIDPKKAALKTSFLRMMARTFSRSKRGIGTPF